MVRLLLLFFLIYLLRLILSIIPSFFYIFEIGSVFMALFLTGLHLILPRVLRQSPSKNPLHLSQIFLVMYLKVPPMTHFFTLFKQPLFAQSLPRTQPNTTSKLMTPIYRSLKTATTEMFSTQNFISQLAMISFQSALLLVILGSSSILACHSQIKSTPCLYLVIFISETSVVFVISVLFL